ncbi:ShKT domain-containing protein [Plasmodiophora brassicae]|uniref:ShKT domain-containing protein n=1 Tax=Plasmodiophora brassicae TaxID=37360 RepID=A0A0G4J206_PLABS|nr:hypothetical protein PBRA_001932 [Plasmodiophora brassicae]SPR01354.1 unnamed protein product [Plasmodiophora brassicae]
MTVTLACALYCLAVVAGATGYDKGKQPAANDSDYFYKPLPRLARGHPKITVPADNEEIAVACSTKYETCTARPDSTATQKWCRDNCFHDPAFCPTDFCTPDCYEHIAIGDRKTSAEYQAGNRYPYTSDHDARDSGSTTSYSPADYYASLPSPVACASSSASFGKQSEPVRPHGTYRGHDATLYDQCTALPESTANQEWCQNNCFNDPPYCPTDFCASDCYKHIAPKDRMTRAEYKAAGLCPVPELLPAGSTASSVEGVDGESIESYTNGDEEKTCNKCSAQPGTPFPLQVPPKQSKFKKAMKKLKQFFSCASCKSNDTY